MLVSSIFFSQENTPFDPNIEVYPKHLHSLISEALESQSEIGWRQATKGFLSARWRDLASKSMFQIYSHDDAKGMTSMRSIMSAIHAYCIQIWLSRNQVLHSTDDADLEKIRSAEMAEITLLHGQPDLMSMADRYLCSQSLQSLLSSGLRHDVAGLVE